MCVDRVTVPNSSLCVSHPPGGPGPYACLVCKSGHTGQDPANLTGTRDCECRAARVTVCVCIHLLQLRWFVWHITPDPTPLGRNVCACRPSQVTRCRCSVCPQWTCTHPCVCVGTNIHQTLSAWVCPDHTQPPPAAPPKLCVLYQMGCQGHLWAPAALWLMGQPSPVTPLYCTMMGIWHHLGPFIKKTNPPRTWAS